MGACLLLKERGIPTCSKTHNGQGTASIFRELPKVFDYSKRIGSDGTGTAQDDHATRRRWIMLAHATSPGVHQDSTVVFMVRSGWRYSATLASIQTPSPWLGRCALGGFRLSFRLRFGRLLWSFGGVLGAHAGAAIDGCLGFLPGIRF